MTTARGRTREERATASQRMLWLMARHRGAARLNYPLLLRLGGPLDHDRLRSALDVVVARHEALRTTFGRRQGLLTQIVGAPAPVPVETVAVADPAHLVELVAAEVASPIDPTVTALRVTLWQLRADDHLLCLNAHHLVTDAWSARLVCEELERLLDGPDPLPPVGWQYRHYARWESRPSSAARRRADGDYWKHQLAGLIPPGLSRRTDGPPGDTRTVEQWLDTATAERIRDRARRERTTPFTVLLALYYLVLSAETGNTDLAVTAPFANRTRPETQRTVGLFANMVVLRTVLAPGSSLTEAIRRTRTTVGGALAHQGYPYHLLPLQDGERRQDRFDDVVFQMLPELPPPARAGGLRIEVVPPDLASRFDLELVVVPHPRGYRVLVQNARDRVPDGVADRIARRYGDAAASLATV